MTTNKPTETTDTAPMSNEEFLASFGGAEAFARRWQLVLDIMRESAERQARDDEREGHDHDDE